MAQHVLFAFLLTIFFGCGTNSGERVNNVEMLSETNSDNSILFIGTYTKKEGHVDGKAAGIYVYSFNAQTGEISYLATSDSTVNPSYIAVHPSGKYVYSVNETNETNGDPFGSVTSFLYNSGDHTLSIINQVTSAGDYPCNINIDRSGRFIFDANYGTGSIAMYSIQPDGGLSVPTSVVQQSGSGPTSRQESSHGHMIRASANNQWVYSIDLGADAINVYELDTVGAQLIEPGITIKTAPGAGPRQLVFHPDDPWAYVINELNGTIESFQQNKMTGMLTRFQKISTVENADPAFAACGDIQIHPSGKFLYSSNRGDVNTIAVFTIDQKNGVLTLSGSQSTKGRTPRNFVIDPSGKYLLVANQDTDNVVTFAIDQATGLLIDHNIESKVLTPVCLKFLSL